MYVVDVGASTLSLPKARGLVALRSRGRDLMSLG